jgi:hypothetical protein
VDATPQGNAYLRARFEELLGEYERLRRDAAEAGRRTRAARGTAKSTDSSIEVTVDAQGKLAGLTLDAKAYRRFSPSQLADQIMTLAGRAVDDVTGQLAEVMAPFLPRGVNYADLVSGAADPADLTPEQPLTDETYDTWRARFSGRETTAPSAPSSEDGGR